MRSGFLIYGAYGYVGRHATRMALEMGLQPVVAGRDAARGQRLATDLGVEHRAFNLDDALALDRALDETPVVLHCAGPYIHTYRPMVDACLRTGTHYLDLTGEIPVYQAIAARDAEAMAQSVMLLPGVGFDVTPTDCLALHLKQRLPSASHLALAFQTSGPAGLPPGTQRTGIELMAHGDRLRRDGELVAPQRALVTRHVDFGRGPVKVARFTWGDVFTAYHSTGIPNIEVFIALSEGQRRLLAWMNRLRPLFRLSPVRKLLQRNVGSGATDEELARSSARVWGEVRDDQGHSAVSRLYGPEATVIWTVRAALAAVRRVLDGDAPPGFQTPAKAYGADFVLESEGVTREDVS